MILFLEILALDNGPERLFERFHCVIENSRDVCAAEFSVKSFFVDFVCFQRVECILMGLNNRVNDRDTKKGLP